MGDEPILLSIIPHSLIIKGVNWYFCNKFCQRQHIPLVFGLFRFPNQNYTWKCWTSQLNPFSPPQFALIASVKKFRLHDEIFIQLLPTVSNHYFSITALHSRKIRTSPKSLQYWHWLHCGVFKNHTNSNILWYNIIPWSGTEMETELGFVFTNPPASLPTLPH